MQMAASIALGRGGKDLFRGHERERSRHRFVPVAAFLSPPARAQATDSRRRHLGMKHTWYVTFEVPPDGTLLRRRHPRLTKTFETEAEAKDFARTKFNEGLVVTAGTMIPHLPRTSIPSPEIPAWLEADQVNESSGPTKK
jgi:hypothetical protein